ncbi:hypothetical protein ACIQ7Q_08150 [Streptomyces sp. NPDC096176]|uniref:hypothetical protein n=1 Tax=Streptomyces sp. NPDC096176 TaxID=3366079 RepID=UPI0038232411
MAHGENAALKACTGAAAAVLLLLTGCSSSGEEEPGPPKASSTAQGKEQKERSAAERGALAAYRGMWDAQVKAYSTGSMENARLGDYTTGEAAKNVISAFTYYNGRGLTFKGKPKVTPKVTAIDVKSDPYTATISDCVDTTDYVLVKRTSGKPVAVAEDDNRRPWTATATTAKAGGTEWRISDYTIDKDRTC